MSVATFQYTTTENLTTASTALKAFDLAPTSVVKKGTNTWDVSYATDALLSKASRLNALYGIFCSGTQYTDANQDAFTQLRIDFCLQPETYPSYYCPFVADYNKLGETKACSRLYSTNNDFNNSSISNKVQCSGLTKHLDVRDTDEAMKAAVQNGYKQFCKANPTMKECQCYNRATFTAYKDAVAALTSGGASIQSGNESCWYVPCQYQNNITVDPDIQQAYARVQCPNVCQNIVAAINVKTAVFSDISLSNDCVGSSAATGGTIVEDISKGVKKEEVAAQFEAAKTQPATKTSQASVSTGVIVGVVVGVVVVVVVLVAYFESPPTKKASGRRS